MEHLIKGGIQKNKALAFAASECDGFYCDIDLFGAKELRMLTNQYAVGDALGLDFILNAIDNSSKISNLKIFQLEIHVDLMMTASLNERGDHLDMLLRRDPMAGLLVRSAFQPWGGPITLDETFAKHFYGSESLNNLRNIIDENFKNSNTSEMSIEKQNAILSGNDGNFIETLIVSNAILGFNLELAFFCIKHGKVEYLRASVELPMFSPEEHQIQSLFEVLFKCENEINLVVKMIGVLCEVFEEDLQKFLNKINWDQVNHARATFILDSLFDSKILSEMPVGFETSSKQVCFIDLASQEIETTQGIHLENIKYTLPLPSEPLLGATSSGNRGLNIVTFYSNLIIKHLIITQKFGYNNEKILEGGIDTLLDAVYLTHESFPLFACILLSMPGLGEIILDTFCDRLEKIGENPEMKFHDLKEMNLETKAASFIFFLCKSGGIPVRSLIVRAVFLKSGASKIDLSVAMRLSRIIITSLEQIKEVALRTAIFIGLPYYIQTLVDHLVCPEEAYQPLRLKAENASENGVEISCQKKFADENFMNLLVPQLVWKAAMIGQQVLNALLSRCTRDQLVGSLIAAAEWGGTDDADLRSQFLYAAAKVVQNEKIILTESEQNSLRRC